MGNVENFVDLTHDDPLMIKRVDEAMRANRFLGMLHPFPAEGTADEQREWCRLNWGPTQEYTHQSKLCGFVLVQRPTDFCNICVWNNLKQGRQPG